MLIQGGSNEKMDATAFGSAAVNAIYMLGQLLIALAVTFVINTASRVKLVAVRYCYKLLWLHEVLHLHVQYSFVYIYLKYFLKYCVYMLPGTGYFISGNRLQYACQTHLHLVTSLCGCINYASSHQLAF